MTTLSPALIEARRLLAAGISFIPIAADGTKGPATHLLPKEWNEKEQCDTPVWKPYTKRLPTPEEVEKWFAGRAGIGIVGGVVSGNLEQLDLDEPGLDALFEEAAADQGPDMQALVMGLVKVRTPRPGTHYRYRLQEPAPGSRTLARNAEGEKRIETKGEGGYAIAPGSPPSCHPENKRYELMRGDLADLPVLTEKEHYALMWLAREFNQYEQPKVSSSYADERARRPRDPAQGLRAGDDYNERGDILPVLLAHGWETTHQSGDTIYLRRPGKSKGHSATLRNGIFTLFTTSTPPFLQWEEKKAATGSPGYSPFAVYTILEHSGDFKTAASALYREGFGEQSEPGAAADLEAVRQEARKKAASEQADKEATSDESTAAQEGTTEAADLPPPDEITNAEQWRHWWGQAWQRRRDHEIADKLTLGHLYNMQVADFPHGQKSEWINDYLYDPEGHMLRQIRNWASVSKAYPDLTARAWRGETLWQNGDRPKTWQGLCVLAAREKSVRNEYLKKRMSVPQMQQELREKGIIGPKPEREPKGWRACESVGLPTKVANILTEETRKDGAAVVMAKVETIFNRRKAGEDHEYFEDTEKERLAAENRYLKAQLGAAQHDLEVARQEIAALRQEVEKQKADAFTAIEESLPKSVVNDEAPFFTTVVKNEPPPMADPEEDDCPEEPDRQELARRRFPRLVSAIDAGTVPKVCVPITPTWQPVHLRYGAEVTLRDFVSLERYSEEEAAVRMMQVERAWIAVTQQQQTPMRV